MKSASVRAALPQTLLVALLVFGWLSATAWARPLMLPDEGRYVGVAWEMLRSGDWLTPTLNGLPYFHKPPLFYWITAAALSLFGAHQWAARVAPLLGATLAAVSIFLLTRRWCRAGVAKATLVVMLVQPLFFVGGQFANLDMLVAGLITATITLFAHVSLSAEHGTADRRALPAAYALAALAVLAKGLIGIVIPLLVIVAWLLLRRRWRGLGALWSTPALLVFLLLAAPWFVAMQVMHPGFLDYVFVEQHFRRFAAGGFNNVQPWWFYPIVLGAFFLPWLPWLVRLPTRQASDDQSAVRLLMWSWVLVVTGFFSLPQSKLLGYILPVIAPMAWLAADGLARVPVEGRRWSRRAWPAVAVMSALLGIGTIVWLSTGDARSSREVARILAHSHRPGEPVLMLGSYRFDLPFYARLQSPAIVVDDWSNVELLRRDSWRKELADAGHFAPQAAAARLIEPMAVAGRLCTKPISWVVGPPDSVDRFPFLAAAQTVSSGNVVSLWRVESALPGQLKALGCAERPNADSTSM